MLTPLFFVMSAPVAPPSHSGLSAIFKWERRHSLCLWTLVFCTFHELHMSPDLGEGGLFSLCGIHRWIELDHFDAVKFNHFLSQNHHFIPIFLLIKFVLCQFHTCIMHTDRYCHTFYLLPAAPYAYLFPNSLFLAFMTVCLASHRL